MQGMYPSRPCNMGKAYARVFPEPVGAEMQRSCAVLWPPAVTCQAAACTGNSSTKPPVHWAELLALFLALWAMLLNDKLFHGLRRKFTEQPPCATTLWMPDGLIHRRWRVWGHACACMHMPCQSETFISL